MQFFLSLLHKPYMQNSEHCYAYFLLASSLRSHCNIFTSVPLFKKKKRLFFLIAHLSLEVNDTLRWRSVHLLSWYSNLSLYSFPLTCKNWEELLFDFLYHHSKMECITRVI